MSAPQEDVDRALAPLLARLRPAYEAGRLDRSDPGFWAARAAEQFPLPGGHTDRGIVSIFLLNLVRLGPGQGMFIPAGVLHAYLEGVLVEVMAASDNVLRGGLTPKHVDTGELLPVLRFDGAPPEPLACERPSPFERVYRAPAAEFGLSQIDLVAGSALALGPVRGADVLLVVEGNAVLYDAAGPMELPRGAAVLAPDRLRYGLSSAGGAVVFRSFVPGVRS
jgi:mannose-6-phosphate isomerase